MALPDLDTATMNALTTYWVTDARDVLGRPMLADLVETFEEIDQRFMDIRRIEARLTALEDEVATAEATHATDLRRCWAYLSAIIDMASLDIQGEVHALGEALMAQSAACVDGSFRDRGRAAERAQRAFTDDMRVHLEALNVPGVDLPATMHSWIEAGVALGALDEERDALQRARKAIDEVDLRRDWIKAVEQLRAASRSDHSLDREAKRLLFRRLSEAEFAPARAS